MRLSVGRADRFAAVGEGAMLLPWEAVSDSEATQSSTAFTVVLPPSAQALPAHCRTWAALAGCPRATHALHPSAQALPAHCRTWAALAGCPRATHALHPSAQALPAHCRT